MNVLDKPKLHFVNKAILSAAETTGLAKEIADYFEAETSPERCLNETVLR